MTTATRRIVTSALRDERYALLLWQNAPGLPADVREGIEISLSKITEAIRALRTDPDMSHIRSDR